MITIKLFAILKDKAGRNELHLNAGPSTISELRKEISNKYPPLAEVLSRDGILSSVNQEFVKSDAPVRDGDEVAFMPPFSGGSAASGHISIQRGNFSLDKEIEGLKQASPSIGAVVTFLGTTRDISKGVKVIKLEFEHYPGMAEKQLEEIRERAMKEYGVIAITIIHRVGALPIGENIVLIAVAAEHRDEAFRACRFCIDELKRIAPIWKKETTPWGEEWVEKHP
jgi:molybdopterin synthase catalytic subunit/molybdopterin converting factor small subunit